MAKSQFYQKLKYKPDKEFLRFTGFTKLEFSFVLSEFLNYVDQNWSKRGRFIAGELKADLTDEDRLLMTLRYLREYPTFLSLGHSFGISESYCHDVFNKVADALVVLFKLPSRAELKNLNIVKVIADVTEQSTERPIHNQKKVFWKKEVSH